MVRYKSTAKEASFEWSHYRISSTDSKVRNTLLTAGSKGYATAKSGKTKKYIVKG